MDGDGDGDGDGVGEQRVEWEWMGVAAPEWSKKSRRRADASADLFSSLFGASRRV